MDYRLALLSLLVLFVFGCTQSGAEESVSGNSSAQDSSSDWKDSEFKDVNSGETFKISDFRGQTVLVETFAVWCPTCLAQQRELAKVDSAVHVSLDVDPNEDEAAVIGHAAKNGFDWRFAVSPSDATQLLIDEFGVSVVNAPGAPVILVCDDQSTRYLRSGLKRADELESEIAKGC